MVLGQTGFSKLVRFSRISWVTCLRRIIPPRENRPVLPILSYAAADESKKPNIMGRKVKNDHRSKFSNLSNCKEEA